jgi:hypothetical protein
MRDLNHDFKNLCRRNRRWLVRHAALKDHPPRAQLRD